MNRLLMLLLPMCALPATQVPAQEQIRRAAPHAHSVSTAQLAVDAGRIDLMLQVPGANLVEFEHPPRNGDERARLDEARRRLAAGAWLVLPDAAGCSSDFEVEMPGFDAHESGANVGHEHDDEHAHAHEHENEHENGRGHAEFRVTATARCDRPGALEWVEIRLFEGWPDNRSLRIDAISATRQWRVELSAERPRIVLQ